MSKDPRRPQRGHRPGGNRPQRFRDGLSTIRKNTLPSLHGASILSRCLRQPNRPTTQSQELNSASASALQGTPLQPTPGEVPSNTAPPEAPPDLVPPGSPLACRASAPGSRLPDPRLSCPQGTGSPHPQPCLLPKLWGLKPRPLHSNRVPSLADGVFATSQTPNGQAHPRMAPFHPEPSPSRGLYPHFTLPRLSHFLSGPGL